VDGDEFGSSEEDTDKDMESARLDLANAPLPTELDAVLVVAERSHPLTSIRTLVGRGAEADIQIHDRRASRRHASIFYSGNEFRVRDEGSANGTLLNGSKVGEYVVRDGDELVVGHTTLRFRIRQRVQ
jgi:pSer/pThr/pTyr-binding forkhead associated (FHA) protein